MLEYFLSFSALLWRLPRKYVGQAWNNAPRAKHEIEDLAVRLIRNEVELKVHGVEPQARAGNVGKRLGAAEIQYRNRDGR